MINLPYFVESIAALYGIPVRIYENGSELFHTFPITLPRDPMFVCQNEIFSIEDHVGYYVTPLFHYYGVINADEKKLIFGPAAQFKANDQALRELAFQADVPKEDVPAFLTGMNAIAPLSLERLLKMLCTVNHVLNNGEMLKLSDVMIYEAQQETLKSNVEKQRTARVYEEPVESKRSQNALAIEESLMEIVRKGDTAALRSWLASVPPFQGGVIADNQLRQLRNTFVVSATLASRAAIRGGMQEHDAFNLSDAYILRAEQLKSHSDITNLQFQMLMEYTEQVEKLHRGRYPTKLATDVAVYIRHHLSEPISVDEMAEEFYMSRPYLSAKFKKETNMTLTDFILNEKTEEAKRLLRYSDKSASAIAAYLGFSSHGHFCKVFKKYAGLTPNEYREKHRK